MSDPRQPSAPRGSTPSGRVVGLVLAGLALGLVVLGAAALLLFPGGGPGAVVDDYVRAQVDNDFRTECELRSARYRQELLAGAVDCADYADRAEEFLADAEADFEETYGESYADAFGDVTIRVEIDEVTERGGDEAIVGYTGHANYRGDNVRFVEDFFGGDRVDSGEGWYLLVKEDGDWRVDADCSHPHCAATGD
ncbi:hypothetical protein E8D34_12915 [Nocardioides sp. GY 10113]|uniref:hypothetical protein n=1 Tax=Nocardioides sp. GY 10113 TaxID=2569761 RepID=UPI0010A78FDA|nr:hypothetical protein [Nocardioides sp. GY 10113]TIC84984.1 hypothetical protein E8D34_12915 [Nocardioides sp. GY 10113]